MTKKLLTILAAAAVLLLIAGVGVLLPHPAAPAAETAAPAAQETPAPVAQEMPAREALIEGYLRTAGSFHPGTAGSSLNRARAACEVLRFCSAYRFDLAEPAALRALLREAVASLDEAERGYYADNLEALAAEIEGCRADWSANTGRYEDAGAAEEMALLLQNEAALASWEALLAASRE